MNVLSLFDGISCGQLALQRARVPVKRYFASEIEPHAKAITQFNFPETHQLGRVENVQGDERYDLVLAGSPCQGFSFAGKRLNFDDPRSSLFFEFVRILQECRDDTYFLLENVRMDKRSEDTITELLGVEPLRINSRLFSAQNRPRLYWTNIPQGTMSGADSVDTVADILQPIEEVDPKYYLSDLAVAKVLRHKNSSVLRDSFPVKSGTIHAGHAKISSRDAAYVNLDLLEGGVPIWQYPRGNNAGGVSVKTKMGAVTSGGNWKGNTGLLQGPVIRRFTPIEAERLQTLPDEYTAMGNYEGKVKAVADTNRYHAIGNGWTVDVVAWLLRGLHNEQNNSH